MDEDQLELSNLQGIVWGFLETRPGVRPKMAEVAAKAEVSVLQLRRYLRRNRRANFREIRAWSCLTYAAWLIAGGIKIEAAMRLAGFHSRSNFGKWDCQKLCV
jgi:methylphosphotriester-DNA--protein-cysteine methyltransferase